MQPKLPAAYGYYLREGPTPANQGISFHLYVYYLNFPREREHAGTYPYLIPVTRLPGLIHPTYLTAAHNSRVQS